MNEARSDLEYSLTQTSLTTLYDTVMEGGGGEWRTLSLNIKSNLYFKKVIYQCCCYTSE
jgi:hypothetical protein